MTSDGGGPGLRLVELTLDECHLRLGPGGIGRVAVSVDALPAVFPVNYAMLDDAVVFRTGSGTKLDAALEGAVVAFEIDQFHPMSHEGWSVLVIGTARVIADADTLARAAALPLLPWARGPRDTFVLIEPARTTGRTLTLC